MAARFSKNILSANNKAVKEFVGGIAGAMSASGKFTMQNVAQAGIERMVDAAEFGDYTGVLANSYQAVLFDDTADKLTGKTVRDLSTHTDSVEVFGRRNEGGVNQSTFHVGRNMDVYTSKGMSEVEKISFRKIKGKNSYKLRRGRTPGEHATSIPARSRRDPSYGYGRDITAARGFKRWYKAGFAVLFNNPTPYAMEVHNGVGLESGQTPHRVFPTSSRMTSAGELAVIYEGVLRKNVNKLKHSRKRRR